MKFPKCVVVAVDLADDIEVVLSRLHKMDFIKDAEIHLVHVSLKIVYSYPIGFGALTYPITDDRVVIEQTVVKEISDLKDRILPVGHTGRIVVECLFGEKPAETFCNYAKEKNADLMIVVPRKKKGIFDSSFAKYVINHSDINVMLLKDH